MNVPQDGPGRLLAVSDLHVTHPQNRTFVERLWAEREEDWLIVCGDVSDNLADVEWALGLLAGRFAKVIWAPGNRFKVAVVVYGHLHIPRTTFQDGVRFEEVSLGYPREWRRRRPGSPTLRTIAPPAEPS